jgi:hypothetical protein
VDDVAENVRQWQDVGASHLSIHTMAAGLDSIDEHVALLGQVASALDLAK